ncbi:GMC family oxidoreductase [Thalassovita sp.]|uniref:GMC family oxidoreductase n=1 Tax=Thalassovita sp. TaxID=1979401 RepID=UPI0029DE6EB4|nr:GMC family oxidoreductase [Thalassovita sp.]
MTPDFAAQNWDVIVIGTGIGGGTVGRRLAERGLSVLFVEKGPNCPRTEQTALNPEMFDPPARRIRGFWPGQVHARINGRDSRFFGPVGAGVGGSSVFYAATLERPEPHDLDDSPDRPHPTGGWPVSHAEYRPYFDQVEQLYAISGEADPLSTIPCPDLLDPPPLSAADKTLQKLWQDKGLHPYHLHSAIRRLDGCKDCLGFKCPKRCKMDGRSAGVEPALDTGRAALLDNCEVQALEGDTTRITGIRVIRNGQPMTLRARTVVLAAGAFGTPRLLLASRSDVWPTGCANASGFVGRNLMFHLNELVALWPGKSTAPGVSKALGFRDLYHVGGERYGMVQAMGIQVSYGEIVYFLKMLVERSALRRIPMLKELVRIPAAIAAKLFGNAQVFVGLMEDLPYPENCVLLDDDPDVIRFEYTLQPELLRRRRSFRRLIRKAFRGQRHMFLGLQPELNFGHPCGTVRFGTNPETSVLNRDCRAHGLENLYVADASVFPTSFGVNPSLMIAANALRVADVIADQHKGTSDAP